MVRNIINNRIPVRSLKPGLLKLLLISTLCTVNLPAFSANNVPPVISGTPASSVVAGNSYFFQPTATDANGNKLRFSIANRPAWASFSGKNGRLSGTPGAASAGTYSNIVISVSDGKSSASLPGFSVQVEAETTQSRSVNLSWIPPVARADGTPLSLADISGYRIYYGTSTGNYTSHVDLLDGTAQQVSLTNLPPGTYYMVMTTYDMTGLESGYSAELTDIAR